MVNHMENNSRLVVVLSRNFSTGLSVIRSLGAAGYRVDLVASTHKEGQSILASSSKYVRKSVEVVSKKVKTGGDIPLLEALLAYKGQEEEKPILFPTDDYTTSIMDLNRDALSEIFDMPYIVGGGQGSIMNRMDKTFQSDLARSVGLNTPKEWIVSLQEEFVVPDDMVFPCFVKPLESVTGYKREMKVCETPEGLIRHLDKLRYKFAERSILVQEFLNIDYEIDLSGLCFDQKVIIPAIIKKTNVAQYEKGVTLAGVVVPFEELDEDIREKTVKMLQRMRYFGMFDMEFNVCGDKVYFNEVNLRSGGPNYSYFASGVNLPDVFVKELTGQGHTEEEEKVTEYGKDFIYDKVAWDDYIHGFMTKKELDEKIKSAAITLLANEDDPEPGRIFQKDMNKQAVKYFLKTQKKNVKRAVKATAYPVLRPVKHRILNYPQMKPENQRNPESDKMRVIVAGRNYCSNLCMARSLGEAGYEVEVLKIFQTPPSKLNPIKAIKPDAYSKYVKAYRIIVSRRRSRRIKNALLNMADIEGGKKMLLIPCCDLAAEVIDRFYDELKEFFIMPNINDTQGELSKLMEKGIQKELARAYGLPVVNGAVIKTFNKRYTIPPTINYPCFVKPNVSRFSSKKKMAICQSEGELKEYIRRNTKKKDIEIMVEDCVDIAKEYSILGLSTKDGAIGPGIFVAEEGGHEEHRGVAITGRILPNTFEKELFDKMTAFMGTLGFEGLWDIDIIQTTDGKFYFVEANMRYGASGYAVTKCGANLPAMFADYMLKGTPIDLNCQVAEWDKTFVSEKVLIEEYMAGRIPFSMVKECMENIDIHFVKNDEDPKPYEHFKKFFNVSKLMKQYYKNQAAKKAKKDAERAERNAKARMAKLVALEQANMINLSELGDLDELLYSIDFYDRIGISREVIRELMAAQEEEIEDNTDNDDSEDQEN